MNRAALNSTVLGSSGLKPSILSYVRDVLRLVGSVSGTATGYASIRSSHVLNSVVKGYRLISAKAEDALLLAASVIARKEHLSYGSAGSVLVLSEKVIASRNSLKYTVINETLTLASKVGGVDVATGDSGRVITVAAQNRTFTVAASNSASKV